nr:unnamed protein product [Callosobruchus chinensis]
MPTHSDSLSNNKRDEYIVKKHPDFFTRKLYECPECIYKATTKRTLKRHMEEEHSEIASSHELSSCVHCGASFKSKMSLDDHILKKHPDFISFVSRKIHQCTICFYKTVVKSTFDNHMSTHPEATPRYELSRCVHCNATFKRKESLEDHVLKKHPEFFTSGTKKVHECTNCTYKTLIKYHLDKHIASIHHLELRLCVHCGTTFKTKTSLDDHIVKIHPDYITTVTSKLHECSKCTYKTTIKQDYNKHILVHPETASCFDVFRCPHCEVTFRRKESLDDHVLKNHPDFFTSHTKKVYECTGCSFRTTMKKNFYRHMSSLVHRKTK